MDVQSAVSMFTDVQSANLFLHKATPSVHSLLEHIEGRLVEGDGVVCGFTLFNPDGWAHLHNYIMRQTHRLKIVFINQGHRRAFHNLFKLAHII